MLDVRKIRGLESLILKKLDKDYYCKITDTDSKEDYFIQSNDRGQTYSLYRGCDLEVGDVSLGYIARTLYGIHQEFMDNIKKVHIGKWGGTADVHVVGSLSSIPQGARYICSDNSLDIYESEMGVVYGVRS